MLIVSILWFYIVHAKVFKDFFFTCDFDWIAWCTLNAFEST